MKCLHREWRSYRVLLLSAVILISVVFTSSADEDVNNDEMEEKNLEAKINEDEPAAEKVEFSDVHVNFRSQKLYAAFETKQRHVLKILSGQRKKLLDQERSSADSAGETEAQLAALDDTEKRVNATFNQYVKATNELQSVLDRNYRVEPPEEDNPEDHRKRLEDLQVQAVKEEKVLQELQAKERAKDQKAEGPVRGNKIEDVLQDVGEAADTLKQSLKENTFHKVSKDHKASLMTVVKLSLDEMESDPSVKNRQQSWKSEEDEVGGMTWLVDSSDNQYVLIKPRDTTIVPEDINLLNDIVYLMITCFVCGWICHIAGVPDFIGFVFAGTLLGPAGFNVLVSVVQVYTLGGIGVFLVLFTLGLEFSAEKLRDVFRVAVVGGSLTMLLTVVICVSGGLALGRALSETLFVAVCIGLSSTTVAANNMRPSDQDTAYGRGLLGILVMQDVYLGVVIAFLPRFAAFEELHFVEILRIIGTLLFSFIILSVVSVILAKYGLARLYHSMHGGDDRLKLAMACFVCFVMLKFTAFLGISMELGCFVAGMIMSLSDAGSKTHTHLLPLIEPVKDFFMAIFFASVGMHIYPTFLMENMVLLIVLTAITVIIKYCATFMVLSLMMGKSDLTAAHLVSVGLAQISEFCFVLASRGIRLQIISQPVYFLMLSITALTLLLAPVLWHAALKVAKLSR